MTDRQIQAVAEALRPWLNRSSPNASQHVADKAAKADIAAYEEASRGQYAEIVLACRDNTAHLWIDGKHFSTNSEIEVDMGKHQILQPADEHTEGRE